MRMFGSACKMIDSHSFFVKGSEHPLSPNYERTDRESGKDRSAGRVRKRSNRQTDERTTDCRPAWRSLARGGGTPSGVSSWSGGRGRRAPAPPPPAGEGWYRPAPARHLLPPPAIDSHTHTHTCTPRHHHTHTFRWLTLPPLTPTSPPHTRLCLSLTHLRLCPSYRSCTQFYNKLNNFIFYNDLHNFK